MYKRGLWRLYANTILFFTGALNTHGFWYMSGVSWNKSPTDTKGVQAAGYTLYQ